MRFWIVAGFAVANLLVSLYLWDRLDQACHDLRAVRLDVARELAL
jgi:hypothetical protein